MAAAMTAAGLAAQVHEDDESGATVVTGPSPRPRPGTGRDVLPLALMHAYGIM